MPKSSGSNNKMLCVNNLRHAEYYGMQTVFDDLYARSRAGEIFTNLMDVILSRENILLAYRNIKANTGSRTAGTDKLTIADIGVLTPEEVVDKVRFIVTGSKHGYRPRAVRRKDIPKTSGTGTRPLGIPCIWDRLVQQCVKQVMEPICEARFSDNSYGFRPNRSVEQAIAATYRLLQLSNLHYVVEFDVKGFFDNVNHAKLIRQIWALGIRDTHLINVIRRILTAPIRMPDGTTAIPEKGTPQGGIISPLLANIVLNELDHWVDSQWEENPVIGKYSVQVQSNGSLNKGSGYRAMRKTRLKEMHIVRYADDFRIFCGTKGEAKRTLLAITQWLSERLKLEVSPEKTRIVNVKRRYSEFLGFKIKVRQKGTKTVKGKQQPKYVVRSHMSDKAVKSTIKGLKDQVKRIARPRKPRTGRDEITLYNSMVLGKQNYYQIATDISVDAGEIGYQVNKVLKNRLGGKKRGRLRKTGRKLTPDEERRYGKSRQLRFVAGSDEPVYPIGYVQSRNPMSRKRSVCSYTPEGREEIHSNLRLNVDLLHKLMRAPSYGKSAEFMDNRISLYSAQWGKCAVTGISFESVEDIHCHHKNPRKNGGSDSYGNLALVLKPVHRLIHATNREVIALYKKLLNLDRKQMTRLNKFRESAGLKAI